MGLGEQATPGAKRRLNVPCTVCGSVVAVPAGRLADGPRCGRCRSPLLNGKPIATRGVRLRRYLERSELPVLIDVGAPWCEPCRAFEPVFAEVAQALVHECLCLTLDVDDDPESAGRLRIEAVPTLILFETGRELARTQGASDAAATLAWYRSQRPDPADPIGTPAPDRLDP